MNYITDAREKVRKGIIDIIAKYPEAEHVDLINAGLINIILTALINASQNQIIASAFISVIKSLKDYQKELFKNEEQFKTLVKIAKINEFKRIYILELFTSLEGNAL